MAFTFPPTWKLQPKVSAVRSNTTIAVMLQSAHIDKLMPTSCADIAHNPHKCGKELLLQSTVRASPLQLMRCQHWSRFIYLALLQRTLPTVLRSLQCYGHSHEIAFRLHCYRACVVASLLARARLTSQMQCKKTNTGARSVYKDGHCSEIAFRLHCYRACYIASLLTRGRLM